MDIGLQAIGHDFSDVLRWGSINNRSFLRCCHGYGLCLWRLGELEKAKELFTRMVWWNPADNQGIRFLLDSLEKGESWIEFIKKENKELNFVQNHGNAKLLH